MRPFKCELAGLFSVLTERNETRQTTGSEPVNQMMALGRSKLHAFGLPFRGSQSDDQNAPPIHSQKHSNAAPTLKIFQYGEWIVAISFRS
jgi:hypothetical protein